MAKVTVGEVYQFLNRKAPFSIQMDFDNSGFLVGKENAVVSNVLIALDITMEVIQEAKEKGANLILSHHPVIWGQLSSVNDQSQTGKKLLSLIEHGIAAICIHTNLDAVDGGVNSELAKRLNLIYPEPLHEDGVLNSGVSYGIGRVGLRADGPTSMDCFVSEVKESLSLEGVRVLDTGRPVHRVAVGGGACGGMLADVEKQGCDTFLTSEIKHDIYLKAKAKGINLLDAGHYATETIICPVLAKWMKEAYPEMNIFLSETEREVFHYY